MAESSRLKGASGLRILMICPQFRPVVGGYERAAERLAGELARQGGLVVVIAERRDRNWPAQERFDGFVIQRLYCLYRPRLHILTSLLSHAMYLLRHGRQFDIWHAHQYGSHATLAVLLGKLLRRPVVLKLTSSTNQGIGKTFSNGRFAAIQAWAHRRVAACVALTVETVEEARRFGIPVARIVQIGNGVDTAAFRPVPDGERKALRNRLGLGEGFVAISVGRLAEEKNPLGLLEAWRLAVGESRQPWRLVFVGDGPLRSSLEIEIRKNNLQESVTVAGSSDAVKDWLGASDLFVLASHNEGLSNTALEAMACGLPSVVTAVSGMKALMLDTGAGCMVPVDDMQAFARALIELHENPDKRAVMGMRARETIVNNYSIQFVAARYIKLYRDLLSQ